MVLECCVAHLHCFTVINPWKRFIVFRNLSNTIRKNKNKTRKTLLKGFNVFIILSHSIPNCI